MIRLKMRQRSAWAFCLGQPLKLPGEVDQIQLVGIAHRACIDGLLDARCVAFDGHGDVHIFELHDPPEERPFERRPVGVGVLLEHQRDGPGDESRVGGLDPGLLADPRTQLDALGHVDFREHRDFVVPPVFDVHPADDLEKPVPGQEGIFTHFRTLQGR